MEASEVYSDDQITSVIDHVINQMDKDKDGFISYTEFVSSNQVPPMKKP